MNDLTHLQTLTDTHSWGAILPEVALGVFALLLLVVEVSSPRLRKSIPALAIGLQGLVLAYVLWIIFGRQPEGLRSSFGGLIFQTGTTDLMRAFFLIAGVVVSHLGVVYLRRNPLARVEFFHIVM